MREKMRQLKMSIFLLHFWTFHLKKSKCATFWVLAHCARFKKRCARGLGSKPQTQSPKLEARAGCLASSPRPARGSKPSSRVDARRGSARQAPSSARPELAKRPARHTSNLLIFTVGFSPRDKEQRRKYRNLDRHLRMCIPNEPDCA